MISEREMFELSGPLHLTAVDWNNADHQRTVAASLVQGVYMLERDRQEKRTGPQALAPPWWEFFNFQLYGQLVDESDSCIFGAIYEYKHPNCEHWTNGSPSYVIAFRGTITKGDAFSGDFQMDLRIIRNGVHRTPRFELAMQAVRNLVAAVGNMNIWLAGHSLGSAMAMLAGKNMARAGIFLEAFLFNPPFFSAPIERIKDKKLKHGIRFAGSVITAALAFTVKDSTRQTTSGAADPFASLASWVPHLFVNPDDHICSEYVGYFEHRAKMEEIGAGGIERVATQHSLGSLLMNAFGRDSEEPLHLIPSAHLVVNRSPSQDFKQAHGIHQWGRPDLNLQSKVYTYR